MSQKKDERKQNNEQQKQPQWMGAEGYTCASSKERLKSKNMKIMPAWGTSGYPVWESVLNKGSES